MSVHMSKTLHGRRPGDYLLYNYRMKWKHGLVLTFAFLLFVCQPAPSLVVNIIDNDKILTLQTNERVPLALLGLAGITLNPNDHLLLNGLPIVLNQLITTYPITLQVRRAIPITIIMPDGEQKHRSSAFTVGEALQEVALWLRAEDNIDPLISSPLPNSPIS